MSDVNLELIAKSRVDDPLNTWPDHTSCHSRTLMGNFLFDYYCLRCWLERVATEKLTKVTYVIGKEMKDDTEK